MFKLNRQHLKFSAVSFVAAVGALYLSMRLDLQQPYWAMATAYIVSQPIAAAVRSKAIQRLLGTLLGASAAVVMVPRLVNAPLLLSLALSLWVGGCLAISLLDRSPRSYTMMLAGYTAAIIGFGSVDRPEMVFDLAVARSEEISMGILCAALAHSLWFPQPVGEVLQKRIQHWLSEADHWAQDILDGKDAAACRDRVRLAAAASEIHLLATHLPYDTSALREAGGVVHALRDRILMLIPLLSSLSDRLAALRGERPQLDADTQHLLARVAQWLGRESPTDEADTLKRDLAALAAATERASWYGLNRIGLCSRLQEMVQTLSEGRALLAHLNAPDKPLAVELQRISASAEERPLHSDMGIALTSGAAAVIATLLSAFVWIGLGIAQGGAAPVIAAVMCCVFATMDDPSPGIKLFAVASAAAIALAALYLFAVFPAISSYPMLALTLAPTLLPIGVLSLHPRHAMLALFTMLNFCSFLALQEHFDPDFAGFLNANLAQFIGVFIAIYVTRAMRSMSADASARRMLRQTWQGLARLAQGRVGEETEAFLSRQVDRIGLLTPRLASVEDEERVGEDALKDLRVSMDLAVLQALQSRLPASARQQVNDLLHAVGEHYRARSIGSPPPRDAELLRLLDRTVGLLAGLLPPQASSPLAALVGLRRNLFPDARFVPATAKETS